MSAALNTNPGEVLIDWEGPVGAADEANRLLAQISPPSEIVHWLHCYWEPGERWQPVERLVIAQMVPRGSLQAQFDFYRMMGDDGGDTLFAELEGPNPRESGHYDRVKGEYLYDGLPPNITQRQWLLWREQRAYALPLWIVQGSYGGHKRTFSPRERKILRMNGKPNIAPAPGQLPFARFDRRILEKLFAMDRLQKWMEVRQSDWTNRTLEEASADRARLEQEAEDAIYGWLDSQIADIAA